MNPSPLGVSSYLPQNALVMARAEGRDDTHAACVSVEPLPTHAAFRRVAAVDRRGGVNVLAAPLTQWDLLGGASPPLLSIRTHCTDGKKVTTPKSAALQVVCSLLLKGKMEAAIA